MYFKVFLKCQSSFQIVSNEKIGSVDTIRNMTAMSFGTNFLSSNKTGIPTSPASVKPIELLFVRLKQLCLYLFKSLGIGTYAISYLPSSLPLTAPQSVHIELISS